VLERIAADLDNLSLVPNDPHAEKESNNHDPQARHRHKLAEPPPKPKKLSHREQRWDYRHNKKIRPCVRKTERLSTILGSAATGNPRGRIDPRQHHEPGKDPPGLAIPAGLTLTSDLSEKRPKIGPDDASDMKSSRLTSPTNPQINRTAKTRRRDPLLRL
jgi:hypothetical protein